MDLDIGAGLKIDRSKIPDELLELVPYVERWGFSSLDLQDAFVARMCKERPDEVVEFNDVVDRLKQEFHAWSSTLTRLDRHKSVLTDEDWLHPYWHFLDTVKIREITGGSSDDAEVERSNERFEEKLRTNKFKDATLSADEAFRLGNYAAYCRILEPYDDLLSSVQRKKLEIAEKRSGT